MHWNPFVNIAVLPLLAACLVRDYRIIAEHADGSSTSLADVRGNHLRNRRHPAALDDVSRLRIAILQTHGLPRAQIDAVRVFCQD